MRPKSERSCDNATRGRTCRLSAPCMLCWTGTLGDASPSSPGGQSARAPSCRSRLKPNALWCADYKGEFMLGNRRYCYPLTITDFASRYLLTCEASATTQETYAITVFERTSATSACRARSGPITASVRVAARALWPEQAPVWWLRLGIQIERIKPGHPQQNGRHERMHLTLKKEATKPAATTCCSNRRASMHSSSATTRSGRIRPWT